jgi:hypothetical protein
VDSVLPHPTKLRTSVLRINVQEYTLCFVMNSTNILSHSHYPIYVHSMYTKSTGRILSKVNSCSATQEISSIVWQRKSHCRVHENPPLMFILSQMNPVHTPSHFLISIFVSSCVLLDLPSGLFNPDFPTGTLYKLTLCLPCVLYDLSIFFFFLSLSF